MHHATGGDEENEEKESQVTWLTSERVQGRGFRIITTTRRRPVNPVLWDEISLYIAASIIPVPHFHHFKTVFCLIGG